MCIHKYLPPSPYWAGAVLVIYFLTQILPMSAMPSWEKQYVEDHPVPEDSWVHPLVSWFGKDPASTALVCRGFYQFFQAIFAFIASPIIGQLSDYFGRKPFFLLTSLGPVVLAVVMVGTRNLYYFYIAQAVIGILGNPFGIIFAYVADVSEKRDRAVANTRLVAIMAIVIAFGPLLGIGIKSTVPGVDTIHLYIGTGVLGVIGIFYILCFLPESNKVKHRSVPLAPQSLRRQGSFFVRARSGISLVTSSWLVVPLWIILFLANVAEQGVMGVFQFYVQTSPKLKLTEVESSAFYLVIGGSAFLIQGVLSKVLLRCLGEKGVVVVGLFMNALHMGCYGLASLGYKWLLWVGALLTAGSLLPFPVIAAMLSYQASAENQGAMQGVIATSRAVATGVGPLLFNLLYAKFRGTAWDGMPFYFGTVLISMSCLMSIFIPKSASANSDVIPGAPDATKSDTTDSDDDSKLNKLKAPLLVMSTEDNDVAAGV